jgi:hypothetical protein
LIDEIKSKTISHYIFYRLAGEALLSLIAGKVTKEASSL